MKIALIQPKLSDNYSSQRSPYASVAQVPEIGLAVLSSTLRAKFPNAEVRVLNPLAEGIVGKAAGFDLVGMSDWFVNHGRCLEYAAEIKKLNPNAVIVIGGPNGGELARPILQHAPAVDFVVKREGEDALPALVSHLLEGAPISSVPNTFYRDSSGKPRFTHKKFFNLKEMPIWDFSSFDDLPSRLSEYLTLHASSDPWISPPLTMFSYRGCPKAEKEGRCAHCVTAETKGRSISSEQFWSQVLHLDKAHGARIFYISDDIFTFSPEYVASLGSSKPPEARASFRAYAYMPGLAALSNEELAGMARNLKKVGVHNLLFGVEDTDAVTLAHSNKSVPSTKEMVRVMRTLHEFGGVKSTIALVLGLAHSTEDSTNRGFAAVESLFQQAGEAFERLNLSIVVPFAGSGLFASLANLRESNEEYAAKRGRQIRDDPDPDCNLLAALHLKYFTGISPERMNEWMGRFEELAYQYLPRHCIGGFKSRVNSII